MGTEIEWAGHEIIIHSQPSLKYLLTSGDTVVKVDGVEICRTGNGLRFTEKASGFFLHDNRSIELALEIKVDLITFVTIPYRLMIDGIVVSVGRAKITNWQLFLMPIAILLLLSIYIVIK